MAHSFPLRVGVLILPEHPWRESRARWQRAEQLGFAQRLFGAGSNVRNVRTFFSIARLKFETRIARETAPAPEVAA